MISSDGKYYRPVKNLKKHDVYKKFMVINLLLKGNYIFLDDEKYLKELLEE